MKHRYAEQWNETATNWQQTNWQSLLRLFSDLLNRRLFADWLPSNKEAKRLLKTDLFDESLTDGLYPLLLRRAHHVFCMDVSIATATAAKQRYPNLLAIVADVRHLPFAPGSFDVVVSNSTLDHFETSKEIVASLKGLDLVLKNQALLLVTLDNRINPVVYLRNILPYKLLHKLGIVPYFVGATYGPHRLKEVLQELNFSVLDMTAFWHFPRILMVALAFLIDSLVSNKWKQKVLNMILSAENLSKWPTRYITGQFIAARAISSSKKTSDSP